VSSLAWIDFDEAERQRTQRIMSLFQERESRDELGLGAIRDSIADHLFPGTSTIQTRLRYMLFIPWIFQSLDHREAHRRLRIEYFPSYAPQLNPDEGVWSLAKRELANSCPNDVDELMEDMLGSIESIRNSSEKLRGCIAQSELPFSLR
jgi:hypothetical protein